MILSDHFEVPFESLFEVEKFAIKWPMNAINEDLYWYLKKIPDWKLDMMQQYAQRVRCWYVYPLPEVLYHNNNQHLALMHKFEDSVCPNFSSTRNAYQAVAELLARKVRRSKSVNKFYFPYFAHMVKPAEDREANPEGTPVRVTHDTSGAETADSGALLTLYQDFGTRRIVGESYS